MSTRTASPDGAHNARGLHLGRVAGIEIQLDWTLSLIFVLLVFNLGAGLFPRLHPGWGAAVSWATAVGAALLFLTSIVVHELSHALVARRKKISVQRITLFLFGGVAHLESDVPSPGAEFLMAIVGPVVSIVIGIAATWLGMTLAGDAFAAALFGSAPDALEVAVRDASPISTLLLWLGPVNIFLGVFNMMPGFPLDGGRVLRALLWWATGDLQKATRWASIAGQLVAFALMAVGVANLFFGALGQGLWLLVLGWFLSNAARMSYRDLLLRKALSDVPVARLMRTQIDRLNPELSLEGFVRDHVMTSDQQGFPVEEGDTLLGMVVVEQVRRIPPADWSRTTVSEVMTPANILQALPPHADARRALAALDARDVDLPIVEGNHLLGLVRRGDFLKWLRLQSPEVMA